MQHFLLVLFLILLSFSQIHSAPSHKRHNFASSDTGARVISASPNILSSTRILNEDPDKYCLIPQKIQKKWITIQLSEEILMDTFAMANFEHYACSFKVFQVLGTTQYPCIAPHCHWSILGTFFAEDSKKLQEFKLGKPFLTRYLKILFVSHYNEDYYYCTVSVVKVHGSTLLEDLKFNLQNNTAQTMHANTPPNTILDKADVDAIDDLKPILISKPQVNLLFEDSVLHDQISRINQTLFSNTSSLQYKETPIQWSRPSTETCNYVPHFHYFRIDNTCSNRNFTLLQTNSTTTPILSNLNFKHLLPSLPGIENSIPQVKNQNILVFLLQLIQQQEKRQQIIIKNLESINTALVNSIDEFQSQANKNNLEHHKLKEAVDTMYQKVAHLEQELHHKAAQVEKLQNKLDVSMQHFKADLVKFEKMQTILVVAVVILVILCGMLIVAVVRFHFVEAKLKKEEKQPKIGGSEDSPQDIPIVGNMHKQPTKKKNNSFLKKGGFLPPKVEIN